MGKSDYYTIVAKVLVYLYKKYKRINLDEDYIAPMTKDYQSLKITPEGIDYLQDNSKIKKICETLKEAKAIWELFL